eukprot:365257-Chlamydomonas_euryale.AAC.8
MPAPHSATLHRAAAAAAASRRPGCLLAASTLGWRAVGRLQRWAAGRPLRRRLHPSWQRSPPESPPAHPQKPSPGSPAAWLPRLPRPAAARRRRLVAAAAAAAARRWIRWWYAAAAPLPHAGHPLCARVPPAAPPALPLLQQGAPRGAPAHV